jgi:hypothetical protein
MDDHKEYPLLADDTKQQLVMTEWQIEHYVYAVFGVIYSVCKLVYLWVTSTQQNQNPVSSH